ncbi:MAG: hypothetical protein ACQEQH_02420 [Bacillota bacterium]
MNLYDNYKKYYDLTNKQKECIDENNIEKLNKITEQKRKIIENLNNDIDIKQYLQTVDKPKEKYKKLKKLFKKIIDLEEKNTRGLKAKKQDIINNLNTLDEKTKTRKVYLKNNRYEAKFIDKKS